MSRDIPTEASIAFARLLRQYDDKRRFEIQRAVSILGGTASDPSWISIVVAVDFLSILQKESEVLLKSISDETTRAVSSLEEAARKLDMDASTISAEIVDMIRSNVLAAHVESLALSNNKISVLKTKFVLAVISIAILGGIILGFSLSFLMRVKS